MKKTLLITVILITSKFCFAQSDPTGLNIPIKDGHIVYESIIDATGKSKADLYKNARQWFVNYFKNSKDVIQSEDKESGQIIGKGMIEYSVKGFLGAADYYHNKVSIQVDCKENKCRLRIYDIILYEPDLKESWSTPLDDYYNKLVGNPSKVPGTKRRIKFILKNIDRSIDEMKASFKTAMLAKSDDF